MDEEGNESEIKVITYYLYGNGDSIDTKKRGGIHPVPDAAPGEDNGLLGVGDANKAQVFHKPELSSKNNRKEYLAHRKDMRKANSGLSISKAPYNITSLVVNNPKKKTTAINVAPEEENELLTVSDSNKARIFRKPELSFEKAWNFNRSDYLAYRNAVRAANKWCRLTEVPYNITNLAVNNPWKTAALGAAAVGVIAAWYLSSNPNTNGDTPDYDYEDDLNID